MSGLTIRIAEPLVPRVADEFDVGVGSAALLITGFTLSYGLFQLVHGPLGDRLGKLRTVTVALVLAGIASAACAAAPSLSTLAVFRFLSGIGAGAVVPLGLAYIGDTVPYERRQLALGRFVSGILIGQAFGPPIGGLLSDTIGWRAVFLVPGVAYVVFALLLAPIARREKVPAEARDVPLNPLPRYVGLLQVRRARLVLIAVALEAFIFFGSFGYFGAYLKHEFDLSYTAIGLLLAVYGVGGLMFSAFVAVLVRRFGQQGLVGAGGVLLLVGFTAFAVSPGWEGCVPAIGLLGFALFMIHNTLQTHATEMAPGSRGLAVSFFAFWLFLGQTAGVSVFGAFIEQVGYRTMFIASGGGLALLGWWIRSNLRRDAW